MKDELGKSRMVLRKKGRREIEVQFDEKLKVAAQTLPLTVNQPSLTPMS